MFYLHSYRHRLGLAGMAVLGALPLSASERAGRSPPRQLADPDPGRSGIEWQQDAHVYNRARQRRRDRGPGEIHADTLIAHYREAKGAGNTGANTEIYRVDGEGRVTLKRDAQTVVGDRAVYDVDQAIAVSPAKTSS